MDARRWDEVQPILHAAWGLSTERERAELLARECADVELRRQLEVLLAADAKAGEFFSSLADGLAIHEQEQERDLSGRMVGRYRLLDPLGRGGMGVVYLAERADGAFEQKVAVKLLSMGILGADSRARFLTERQLLAGLEHPAIARLLDGGVAADGTPYFVMERIKGERIDRWCDARQQPVEQRVRLVIQVCKAVEAAHRKLIVHRDLKPSNILVTDQGIPKLLDFGVAKMLSDGGPDITGSRGVPLTPAWAAPEQISGDPITTATDTHALGALLHLLLTGVPAYEADGSSLASLLEHLQREPAAASRRFAALDRGQQAAIAETRRTTPDSLRRNLEGDLDAILSRALAPEPDRRYGSAADLAHDLDAHLQSRPVVARAPSLSYRLVKFARRNWLPLVAGLAFALLLGAAFVAVTLEQRRTAVQRDLARVEADRARRVTDFTLALFEAGNPESGEELTARQLLDRGLAEIETLDDDPLAQIEVFSVISAALGRLQRHEEVERIDRRRLEVAMSSLEPSHPEVANALGALGAGLSSAGEAAKAAEAEKVLLQAREHDERYFPGVDRVESLWRLRDLSRHYFRNDDYEKAVAVVEEGLPVARRLGEDELTAAFLNVLSIIAASQQDYSRAQSLDEKLLAMHLRQNGEVHPDTATTLYNLGFLAKKAGALEQSEGYYQRALEIRRKVFDDPHPRIASTLYGLGDVMTQTGRLDRAEVLLQESMDMFIESLGEGHPGLIAPLDYRAALERKRGNFTAAEQSLGEALEIVQREFGPHGRRQARVWHAFALLEQDRGDEERAVVFFRRELEALEADSKPTRRAVEPMLALARLLRTTDPIEARSLLERAGAVAEEQLSPESPLRQELMAELENSLSAAR